MTVLGFSDGIATTRMGWLSGFVLFVLGVLGGVCAQNEFTFTEDPSNITSSIGKDIILRCTVKGVGDTPDVEWMRDGEPLEVADTNQIQVPLDDEHWTATSMLSIPSLQLSDAGQYQCSLAIEGEKILSRVAYLELEGLPFFSEEPQDHHTYPDTAFNLSCNAQGPPDPVNVIWLQDGVPLNTLYDHLALTPSVLEIKGLNKTSLFSCEAHNAKGVTTSRTATVKVLPRSPTDLTLVSRGTTELEVSWQPGQSGVHPLTVCTVQATLPYFISLHHKIYNQNLNVPPYNHVLSGLAPYTTYRVRVSCMSSEGVSHWTDWENMETMEGVPSGPPANVTAVMNGSMTAVIWGEPRTDLNGVLRGYKLSYRTKDQPEVVVDAGLTNEVTLSMEKHVENLTVRVAAYTNAGDGPWSDPVIASLLDIIIPLQSHAVKENSSSQFSWHWWYVVLAVAIGFLCAIFGAIFLARLRKKETRYGEAFEPTVEQGELVVRYRVRKSYSRRTTEATLNRLGISDDLKEKLRDVMIDRHKLALGKTLGEGEFGSVMEGQLNQDDYILRVAVKTMKIAICTRTEMEDFLSEAVCMKEFDHPNVMRLIGVCLQNTENEGYPSPVVILPFMKHGDLHSFLLYSRLGDTPLFLPTQTLVKFMADIASGMEYLSSKNFIHRDLAARNCMLNENMNVCVADFGLSKKIYNGDYYRQGRIAKMPVKWIAIESLADRVYTTKSDVWSFGVTMWEIATRGQTPYPGVENSEIYDYLRQGNRLKQPPDCLDGLYELMSSCWHLNSKDRPTFESLHLELEKILKNLPPAKDPEEILYVNMEDGCSPSLDDGELGAVGGLDAKDGGDDILLKAGSVTAEVHNSENSNRYVMCPAHETSRLIGATAFMEHPPFSSSLDDGTLEDIMISQR
ncbi:tyrosine-protein kinase receptor UFO isoform X2 [Bombina bombina]|uniref:tyrosine-protein kinase receptor UFO isoform X2 n=1 Tax=Bombina bombina TaxID=8345 RepID=UPI00235A4E97|nr:tyrosine-protein kinase receptor UFO isoform X2 [Bombina bombina]